MTAYVIKLSYVSVNIMVNPWISFIFYFEKLKINAKNQISSNRFVMQVQSTCILFCDSEIFLTQTGDLFIEMSENFITTRPEVLCIIFLVLIMYVKSRRITFYSMLLVCSASENINTVCQFEYILECNSGKSFRCDQNRVRDSK